MEHHCKKTCILKIEPVGDFIKTEEEFCDESQTAEVKPVEALDEISEVVKEEHKDNAVFIHEFKAEPYELIENVVSETVSWIKPEQGDCFGMNWKYKWTGETEGTPRTLFGGERESVLGIKGHSLDSHKRAERDSSLKQIYNEFSPDQYEGAEGASEDSLLRYRSCSRIRHRGDQDAIGSHSRNEMDCEAETTWSCKPPVSLGRLSSPELGVTHYSEAILKAVDNRDPTCNIQHFETWDTSGSHQDDHDTGCQERKLIIPSQLQPDDLVTLNSCDELHSVSNETPLSDPLKCPVSSTSHSSLTCHAAKNNLPDVTSQKAGPSIEILDDATGKHADIHSDEGLECNAYRRNFSQKSKLNHDLNTDAVEKHFACSVCDKTFYSKHHLKKHMRIHIGEKLFECSMCGKKFFFKYDLVVHLRVHTGEKPYECDVCTKKFSQKSHLNVHLRIHVEEKQTGYGKWDGYFNSNSEGNNHVIYIGEKQYMCNICGEEFPYKSKLNEHVKIHSGEKPFECNICGKKFNKTCEVSQHIKRHTSEKPFECSTCGKKFSQKYYLKKHLKIHTGEKTFECNACGKKFFQKCELSYHMARHADVKPFECESCKKRFFQNMQLRRHLKIHAAERPFECSVCGKKYYSKRDVIVHMRSHTGERPFKCDVCKKKFSRKSNLIVHMKIHSGEQQIERDICDKNLYPESEINKYIIHIGEKQLGCRICGKQFSYKSKLSDHIRMHTGEKPFECNICGKEFSLKCNMREHTKIHTTETPFECNICRKKFSVKIYLSRHLKTHVGKN